jgi:hypothetical protein
LVFQDDDEYLNASSAQNLGEISLQFWRAIVVPYHPAHFSGHQIPEQLKVHERSKKGVPHRVQYELSPLRMVFLFLIRSLDLEKKFPDTQGYGVLVRALGI